MQEFIQWALAPSRNNDEKYTVELIVEEAVAIWHARHNTGLAEDFDAREERNRQRKLNPAYVASYSEDDLRKAAEVLQDRREWSHFPYSERPLRDLQAFQFLNLEALDLSWCDATDLTPISKLANLRRFTFRSSECRDFRPLAECRNLRHLNLSFTVPWPEVAGLERLENLEELILSGNLLAFGAGTCWPRVRRATLNCTPLAARSCHDFPVLPECVCLSLSGTERLEGIERMPRLRNLALGGPVLDFAPLAELKELTCLSVTGDKPRDVTPLKLLPKLQFAQFGEAHKPNKPRDYSPMAEAPMLRELVVLGCPPVEMEVAAINAGLAGWNDLLFADQPRPLGPFKMIVAPAAEHPGQEGADFPQEDEGMASCESRWMAAYLQHELQTLTGLPHWGAVRANSGQSAFFVDIYAIEAVEMFPEFIRGLRQALARLRRDYSGTLMIMLQNPPANPTPAELAEEERLQEIEDNAYYEQWRRDQEEYLDRLHRYELRKEEGGPIDPAEFSVPSPLPPSVSSPADEFWDEGENEEDDDQFEDSDEEADEFPGEGESAEDEEETFDDILREGEHPMAEHFRLVAHLSLHEIWFLPHNRSLAIHLMGRDPDQESAPKS
jgi:hypothetical protein